jgi:hypothetical protein
MIASMTARVSTSSTPSPLSPRSPAISPIPKLFNGRNSKIEKERKLTPVILPLFNKRERAAPSCRDEHPLSRITGEGGIQGAALGG